MICYLLRKFLNTFSSTIIFSFSKYECSDFEKSFLIKGLKVLADVIFFVSQFSNIWMALISEPLVRFRWQTPHGASFNPIYPHLVFLVCNLGQKVADKLTKLSKIRFSMEYFTADFLPVFTKKRQNLAFDWTAGYSPSNPSISGIFDKFPNFLRS